MGSRRWTTGAAVAVVVGAIAVGGTAWSAAASTGSAARSVSTTEVRPTTTRTKVITFDAEAQLRALIDVPDPLPDPPEPYDCLRPRGRAGSWPVFNGSTVEVPFQRAIMCPGADGSWGITWFGGNNLIGPARLDANATFIVLADGSVRPGMLASVTSGGHQYSYRPASDDFAGDQYLLTDSFYGDLVSTTLGATPGPTPVPTTAPPAAPSGTATAATPVSGTPGYTG